MEQWLPVIWFVLWGLLWAVYFILDGFDFGLGMLLPFLGGEEEEEWEGTLSLSPAAFQIPKGILARKVTLSVEGEEEPRKLNIDDRLVKKLPTDGTRVRVRAVRKFITGIEVLP